MKRYAEMDKNGVVRLICEFEDDFTPKIAKPRQYIEVTNLEPEPKEGWGYIDGEFIENPPEIEQPKELIRFTVPLSDTDRDNILIELAYQHKIEPEE